MTSPNYSQLPTDSLPVQSRTRRPWLLGIITLALVVGAMLTLTGNVEPEDHSHHNHGHDHDHEDYDGHDHEQHFHDGSRREHHCIHDKMVHPEIVRGPMKSSNPGLGPEINDTLVSDAFDRRADVLDTDGATQKIEAWGGDPGGGDANTQYTEATCKAASVHNTGNTASAIRIQLVNGGISTLSSTYQTYLTSTLMPAVKSYFEATLQVAALDTDTSSNFLKCAGTGAVASGHGVDRGTFCAGTGYENKDFVLFYAASDSTYCQGATSTLAYAGPLETMDCDRPVVGYIHFCKLRLTSTRSDSASAAHALQFKTALHEVIHALGFTSRLYAYYRNTASPWGARTARAANGSPSLGTSTISLSTTGLSATGTYPIYQSTTDYFMASETDSTLGHTVSYFKDTMASLFVAAKAQFGCSTLARVEVENQGGSGSWGSHWEKRTFGDELMTSTITSYVSPLTKMTLGFLVDTGFYKTSTTAPTYTAGQLTAGGEPSAWLKSAGCSATTSKCVTSGTPLAGGPWCSTAFSSTNPSNFQCTYDGLAIGTCNKKTLAANFAAANYRYFGDTTSYGEVAASDYCPFVQYFANGKCTDTANSGISTGQVYSSSSRCFTSSLRNTVAYTFTDTPAVGCYSTECLSTSAMAVTATFGANTFVMTCSTTGTTHALPGISGSLTCPAISTTDCPTTTTFRSLTSITVITGTPSSVTQTLLPEFTSAEIEYHVMAISTATSVKITAVSTSTATVTIGGTAATTTGNSHERLVSLSPGVNAFAIVVTAGGLTKTYTVKVIRSDSSSTIIYQKWIMNTATTFTAAAFKTELSSLLGLSASNNYFKMNSGSSFTINPDVRRSALISTTTIDSTLTAFTADKGSSMYMLPATYPILSTTLSATSGVAVACAADCAISNCDPSNGQCSTDTSKPWYEEHPWMLYCAVGFVAIFVIAILYCCIKCLCCKNDVAKTAGDQSSFAAPERKSHKDESPSIQHEVFTDQALHTSISGLEDTVSFEMQDQIVAPSSDPAAHDFAAPRRGEPTARPGAMTKDDDTETDTQSQSQSDDDEQDPNSQV